VRVGDQIVGEIGPGLLVFVGVAGDDGVPDIAYVAAKVPELRIFEDDAGKMNLTLAETGGSILAVSQITLYGDCRRGRRPSFIRAAGPEVGRTLFEDVVRQWRASGVKVETGTFQAHMQVELDNDGPVTILLDSRKEF
jgi:D-tyrosyl-tRNA(Tyr) deacylase